MIILIGKVLMMILFFDMFSGEECYLDMLEIFDGNFKVFILLINFCDELNNIYIIIGNCFYFVYFFF